MAPERLRMAMRLSLAFGVLMLIGKTGAWWFTQSAAILSDAAESVIHVLAVAFAAFSLRLALRPANERFQYGYERIAFFSAGFEGGMIVLAAISIIVAAVNKMIVGTGIDNLGGGTLFTLGASVVNAVLGAHLVRVGKKNHSLILEANGRHVLTDSWTSFGVVAGLGAVWLTGWKVLDPLCAIAVALNILWSGGRLMAGSVAGLMDYADPALGRTLRDELGAVCAELGIEYHELRFRNSGQRLMVELHLLFPWQTAIGEAHRKATAVEQRIAAAMPGPCEVVTHLEAVEDHAAVHTAGKG